MRVVHVVVAGDIGGAERLLVDLAGPQAGREVEHHVALMTPNPKLRAYFRGAGLTLHDRGPVRENPAAYLWRSWGPADAAWLARVMREVRADVAHLHTFQSHVLGTRAAARARVPTLRTEHHVEYLFDASTSAFTRWSLERTDAVVAISEYVARVFRAEAPSVARRMTVVRNGVDTGYFAYAEPRPDRTSARPFTFVVVCRLEPWKQVDLVLEALERVPGARLRIVGEGRERARLEALARPLGERVEMVGYQHDPRPFVASADVSINSSNDEPLGLSVLEAQAIGRPVIGFAGGGLPEIIAHGETGWLVPPRDVDRLSAAMREASLDRGRTATMGRAARRFVENACSIQRMREGYHDAYARLVAATRRS